MHAKWYLGWEKVSCLERCPQFRSVLIEREVLLYVPMPWGFLSTSYQAINYIIITSSILWLVLALVSMNAMP